MAVVLMAVILALSAGVMIGGCAMAVLAKQSIRELERRLVESACARRASDEQLVESERARLVLVRQVRAAETALQRERANAPSSH